MSPRQKRRLTFSDPPNSPKDLVIWILLFLVLVESLLLLKAYQRKTVLVREKPHAIARPVAPPRIVRPRESLPPAAPTLVAPIEKPPPYTRGKIAIIIDDSGYNIEDCEHLASIQSPVTISILPNLKHSTDVAVCAHRIHKEVMLHLPLEPHVFKENYPRGYFITTAMPEEAVVKRFQQALATVPFVAGINNHTGSKATEDERLMSIIFSQLKQRNFFFVDSMVTGKSICGPLASRKNLPFTKRDIFLDNENRREYIEQQFQDLIQEVRKKGFAVAIGHARPLTWKIIKEETEKLKQQGFEMVTVENIIKGRD